MTPEIIEPGDTTTSVPPDSAGDSDAEEVEGDGSSPDDLGFRVGQTCDEDDDCPTDHCVQTPLGGVCSRFPFAGDSVCDEGWHPLQIESAIEPAVECIPLFEGYCVSDEECADSLSPCLLAVCCKEEYACYGTCEAFTTGECCGDGQLQEGEYCDGKTGQGEKKCNADCTLSEMSPPEVPVLSFHEGGLQGPWLAVRSGCDPVVGWEDASPQSGGAVHVLLVDSKGNAAGPPAQLTGVLGSSSAAKMVVTSDCDIVVLKSIYHLFGDSLLLWHQEAARTEQPEAQELSGVSIAGCASGHCFDAVSLTAGTLLLAWSGEWSPQSTGLPLSDTRLMMLRVDMQGALMGDASELWGAGEGEPGRVVVRPLNNGRSVVGWVDTGCELDPPAIAGFLVGPEGQPSGPTMFIQDESLSQEFDMAAGAEGVFVASLRSAVGPEGSGTVQTLTVTLHSEDGQLLNSWQPSGPEATVFSGQDWDRALVLAPTLDGGAVAAWVVETALGNAEIVFQVFSVAGSPLGKPQMLSSPVDALVRAPSVAQLSPGGLLGAWRAKPRACAPFQRLLLRSLP